MNYKGMDKDMKCRGFQYEVGKEYETESAEVCEAAIEYTKERCTEEPGGRATGDYGAASATGYQGAASATGKAAVALACGVDSMAKGSLGCAICVVERGKWDGETYPIKAIKAAIVDGKKLKADTWYTLKGGKIVEVNADD